MNLRLQDLGSSNPQSNSFDSTQQNSTSSGEVLKMNTKIDLQAKNCVDEEILGVEDEKEQRD